MNCNCQKLSLALNTQQYYGRTPRRRFTNTLQQCQQQMPRMEMACAIQMLSTIPCGPWRMATCPFEFAIFAAVKKICRGCFVIVKLNSKPSPSQQQHALLTRKRLLLGELEMGTVTLQNSFCLSMKREPHISDWQKNDSERILNPICYYEQKSLSSFSHDRKWPGRSSSLTAC